MSNTVYLHQGTQTHRIETLYAYLAVNPDGTEGIVARHVPFFGSMPFVFSDPNMVGFTKPIVDKVMAETGQKIHLVKFQRVSPDGEASPG